MDRTNLTIAPALRLLVIGGLFAMFWIIFGAGSAHAAPAPPPGESPNTATGLVLSLNATVKPLITTVQPRTEPAPPSSPTPASVPVPPPTTPPLGVTAPASNPGRQTAPPPTVAPTHAQGPTTALQDLTNPITGFTGTPAAPLTPPVTELVTSTVQPVVAPLTAPVTELVTSTVQPVVAPLTAPVTELVTSTVQPVVAPLTAPVTELVTGTVEPLVAPLTTLAGSALNPIANQVDGITLPLPGLINASPAPTAAVPVAPVTADTFPGSGDRATPMVETRRAAVFTAKSSASTTALSRQFVGVTAGNAPRAAASMNDGGASPQSPTRLPSEYVPATTPAPSPGSGSAGGEGPTGAGAQTAADLSHYFVLPMTGGGEGSLFSFVLPGPTTQDPGFSPD